MPMAHKAYAFDWKAFEIDEFSTLLVQALESDDASLLICYIENHRHSLKDPYEGDPLDENWREMLG